MLRKPNLAFPAGIAVTVTNTAIDLDIKFNISDMEDNKLNCAHTYYDKDNIHVQMK